MSTKLTHITNHYSKFSDNQVLTKAQLNQFLDYFDDQDRLSRIGLSGVGIVCGFEIKWVKPRISPSFLTPIPTFNPGLETVISTPISPEIELETSSVISPIESIVPTLRFNGSSTSQYIEVSQGIAVTTDGDLLKFTEPVPNESSYEKLLNKGKKRFTHYKEYKNDEVVYEPFNNKSEALKLYELAEVDEVGNDADYSELSDLDLSDKVVFLYLESYTKKSDLCTSLSCDNQGQAQVRQLKVLLLDREVAEAIAQDDVIYKKHNWFAFLSSIPLVKAPRDIIRFVDSQVTDLTEIKTLYLRLIANSSLKGSLLTGINKIFEKFGKPQFSLTFFNNLWPNTLNKLGSDFQYRYDLLKDIVSTYSEIRSLLLRINVECCPSITAFPKHIMLGHLSDDVPDFELRHRFYHSPVVGEQERLAQEVTSLIERLYLQLTNFNSLAPEAVIKITPSKTQVSLGEKAIPSYYNVGDTLIEQWSYSLTQQFAASANFGYFNNFVGFFNQSIIQLGTGETPLNFCFEEYDFLRIEGIQGKVYTKVAKGLDELKKRYGLNFDVKALRLSTEDTTIDIDLFDCEFRDLKVLLQAWKSEQNCALQAASSLLSGFKIDSDAGGNVSTTGIGTIGTISTATAIGTPTIAGSDSGTATIDTGSTGVPTIGSGFTSSTEFSEALGILDRAGLTGTTRSPLTENEEKPTVEEIGEAQSFLRTALGVSAFENSKELLFSGDQIIKVDLQQGSFAGKGTFERSEFATVAKVKTPKESFEDKIVKEDNTVGKLFYDAIKKDPDASTVEVTSGINEKLKPIFETDEWKDKKGVQEVVGLSVGILANIDQFTKIIPDKLIQLDPLKIASIKTSLERICELVDTLKEKYEDDDLSTELKNDLSILINQLEGICCAGEKLTILNAEIEERKKKVLESTIFRNFVSKHPGVRHRAGVPMGGTFVMVYQSETTVDEDIIKPFQVDIPFSRQPNNRDKAQLVFLGGNTSASITFLSKTDFGFSPISPVLPIEPIGPINPIGPITPLVPPITSPIESISPIRPFTTEAFSIDQPEFSERVGSVRLPEGLASRFQPIEPLIKIPEFVLEQRITIGKTLEETVASIARLLNENWALAQKSSTLKAVAKGTVLQIFADEAIGKNNYFKVSNGSIINRKSGIIYFEPNEVITATPTVSNTVVADFALPYMCCSDCTPVNFVMPRERVSLIPSQSQYCLGLEETESLISFTVQPEDGKVRALLPPEITDRGVVQDETGVYKFDPSQLDARFKGQPIRFTVNEQSTSASITVYAAPNITITVKEDEIEYNENRTIAVVTYEVEGHEANTKFFWDFGNGNTGENIPREGIVRARYSLPPNVFAEDPNRIAPSLQAATGPCVYPIEIPEVIFEEPIPDASLTLGDVPCVDPLNGEDEVIIEIKDVQPVGGIVAIRTIDKETPAGLEVSSDGSLIVINKKLFSLYDTKLYFWINDESLNDPVLVIPSKNAAAQFVMSDNGFKIFDGQEASVNFTNIGLTPEEKASGSFKFTWNFGDGSNPSNEVLQGGKRFDTRHIYNKLPIGKHTFKVTLEIESEKLPCGPAFEEQEVVIEVLEDAVGKCIKAMQGVIKNYREKNISDADGESPRIPQRIRLDVIRPTLAWYDKVIDVFNTEEDFLLGTRNEDITRVFEDLMRITAEELLERENDSKFLEVMLQYYHAQIQLLFNLLHCQGIELDSEKSKSVVLLLDDLIKTWDILMSDEIKIPIDIEGRLLAYFEDYVNSERISDSLKEFINTEIIKRLQQ